MASQWGTTRKYTSVEEGVSKVTERCKNCNVYVVPRTTNGTRYYSVQDFEKSCPNCGSNMTRRNRGFSLA